MAKGKYEYWISPEDVIKELKSLVYYQCRGNEKELEENIIENIDLICGVLGLPEIEDVGNQKTIKIGGFFIRPDILIRHKDGSMTVFEVKKNSEKYSSTGPMNQMNGVGQVLLYKNVLEEIICAPVRVAIIDNKIYYRTYCAFMSNKLPITLIDFQKDRIFIPYNGW